MYVWMAILQSNPFDPVMARGGATNKSHRSYFQHRSTGHLRVGAELFVEVPDGTRAAYVVRHEDICFNPDIVVRGHIGSATRLSDYLLRQRHWLQHLEKADLEAGKQTINDTDTSGIKVPTLNNLATYTPNHAYDHLLDYQRKKKTHLPILLSTKSMQSGSRRDSGTPAKHDPAPTCWVIV